MPEVVSYAKIRTDMSHFLVFFKLVSKLSLPGRLSVGLAPCLYPRKCQLLINPKQVYLSQKSDVGLGIQWELMI